MTKVLRRWSKAHHQLQALLGLLGLRWGEFSDMLDESEVVHCPHLIDTDVTGSVELAFGDVAPLYGVTTK